MKKMLKTLGAALILALTCTPASAVYNATVQSTVVWVEQLGDPGAGFVPGLIHFRLVNQPAFNCGGGNNFIIMPTPNEQTQKNMFAMLLAAKASGADVVVAYDSNGTGCANGDAIVYYLRVL